MYFSFLYILPFILYLIYYFLSKFNFSFYSYFSYKLFNQYIHLNLNLLYDFYL